MAATKGNIRQWLKEKPRKDVTHMIVVCDTFDWEDYPVYVKKGENPREVYNHYNGNNMQRVMEVYSYRKNLETQLNEGRAFNFD
jgi:hypothetical protein